MKSFLKFVLIFATILWLSALLAPILFDFLPYKFERIFNRLVMIFSLVAIFIFVRLRKSTFEKYGLLWDSRSLRFLFTSFLAGVLILVALALTRVFLGAANPHLISMSLSVWIYRFLFCLGSGLLVGLIEEFFFRGFIYSSLRKNGCLSMVLALALTNLFYALIHFLGKDNPYIGPNPTFFDSLKLMQAPFNSLLNFREIAPAALGLLIFGLILSDVSIHTRSLYPAIGLHAGSVFFLKMDGLYVDFTDKRSFLLGSSTLYDGVLGWVFLFLLGGFIRWLYRKHWQPALSVK